MFITCISLSTHASNVRLLDIIVLGLHIDVVCHPSGVVFCLWGNPPQSCLVGHEHRQPGCHGVARRVPVLEK